ncbi:hypothetical protein FB45DRAFT_1064031 [Roridomyces roridus]|uniref:Uncharacterized protein n=1 Tax=Roridomyces roridus TaxID=1738132 RepID=A0AAD7BBV8_9AGAR|nr:hypothetical protein FB45DRAFT_1064031 [Roridomyces roridus]
MASTPPAGTKTPPTTTTALSITKGTVASHDQSVEAPAASSASSAIGTKSATIATSRGDGYKGKALRSWPQLPPEIIRLIANFHLELAAPTQNLPNTWEPRFYPRDTLRNGHRPWPFAPRTIFMAARDTRTLELLMSVCPQWGVAIEHHSFWNAALNAIDPLDQYPHYGWAQPPPAPEHSSSAPAPGPVKLTPYIHFRNLIQASCLPCLLNGPSGWSHGLAQGRRIINGVPRLGTITVCKPHAERRSATFFYCGVCLRDGDLARRLGQDALRFAQEQVLRAERAVRDRQPGAEIQRQRAAEAARVAYDEAARLTNVMPAECLGVNEDEGVFRGIHATCKTCRIEWLCRQAMTAADEREKEVRGEGEMLLKTLGMARNRPGVLGPMDPQVRDAVMVYLDLAEGTISSVLSLAIDRGWLSSQTRWVELMGQALASRKLTAAAEGAEYAAGLLGRNAGRRGRRGKSVSPASLGEHDLDLLEEYDYEDEDSELDESDDEREATSALEKTITEMALGDWARGRILDGSWVDPADIWYRSDNPDFPVQAVHPVPWAVSPPPSPVDLESPAGDSPSMPTVNAHPGPPSPPPPSYALAEAAHHGHIRQMRVVLLPVLRNIVRRIVVECALDASEGVVGAPDPAMRATRMSLADVVRELREEEGVWFDGVDWSERRKNARKDAEAREREEEDAQRARRLTDGSDDSSEDGTSRTSDTGSSATVHSTPTLGTTPTPPPPEEPTKETLQERTHGQPTIAVMPVLHPPRLLRPIPHVPDTIEHLPPYSMESLRLVWREACAPLYHCRCTVCERAMAAAQAAQGGTPVNVPPAPAPVVPAVVTDTDRDKSPLVLHLPAEDDAQGLDVGSVVSFVEESDLVSKLEDEEYHRGYDDDQLAVSARKRSVDELESEESADDVTRDRGGTPPKRARTGEREYNTTGFFKRRSEELDGDTDSDDTTSEGHPYKRARSEVAESPPASRDSEQETPTPAVRRPR